jgi:TonB family protein
MARRWIVAVTALCGAAMASPLGAQTTPSDSARCEQIVGSARVDSVPAGLFVAAHRIDGPLSADAQRRIALNVGAGFVPPVPLRLSVFAGPVRTHVLRPIGGDTTVDLRAPTITGVYRVRSVRGDSTIDVAVIRSTLIIGFDSSVISAIHGATMVPGLFDPPDDDDTMHVDVRLSTDSMAGSHRLVSAMFPRLPVVDAIPLAGNPPAEFPPELKSDTDLDRGEVVVRFVVDRSGWPALNAIEIVRATSQEFARAALAAMPRQRFRPATVKGCPVSQVIDYPFTFLLPTAPP